MTNPGGESSETPASDPSSGSSEPTSGGYEAPSIEQSQQHDEQPQPQPATEQFTPPPPHRAVRRGAHRAVHPAAAPTEQFTPPGYAPPSTGYDAPPSYQPPTDYQQGGYPPPGYPPIAGLPAAAELPDAGLATAWLPADLPRPVGLRWPAGLRRPGLSPAATVIRRRARVSAPPPSYPAAGYPGGYGGGYGQPQPETNQLAIWSLVASLIGFLCTIGSLVGIALGVIALNQIKETPPGRPRAGHRGHRGRGRDADHQHHLDRVRAQRLT